MLTKAIIKDLTAMGYRPLGVDKTGTTVYAKPFGYTLLMVLFNEQITFQQRFKGKQGILIWDSKNFSNEEPFIKWLQYAETYYVRAGLDVDCNTSFEFLTADELINDLLEDS